MEANGARTFLSAAGWSGTSAGDFFLSDGAFGRCCGQECPRSGEVGTLLGEFQQLSDRHDRVGKGAGRDFVTRAECLIRMVSRKVRLAIDFASKIRFDLPTISG